MGLNKIDTAINCATVGGQNLITLPAILDFTQIATEQQIVPGWGHFIGAGITLDASNLSAFGILKSIAVTLYTGVNPDLVGPQQFVGKIWIFNPQTQQVICIVPGDATYQNAPNGANTYSTSQVIDLIPSTSSKLVIYSEVAGLAGTPSTVTGSINLNNFHLFV